MTAHLVRAAPAAEAGVLDGRRATVGIPGVATVHLNETATGPNGQLIQNAVRVRPLLGQELILPPGLT